MIERNGCMLIALTATVLAPQAAAQNIDTIDRAIDRAEAAADRTSDTTADVGAPYLEGSAPKNWTLSAAIPFTYNNNVALSETGAVGAMHIAPAAELKRKWQLSADAAFILSGKANIDSFTRYSQNDQSGLTWTAEFTLSDQNKGIAPYFRYTGNSLYQGQWGGHIVTTHLFGLGLRRKWPLVAGQNLSVDANYMRREASAVTSEMHRLTGSLVYESVIDDRTAWSLGARVQYSDFTGGAAADRSDVQLRTAIGITHKLADTVTIGADLAYLRNWSNKPLKSYTDIDVGPFIKLSTQF